MDKFSLDEKYMMLLEIIDSDRNTSGICRGFIKSGEFTRIYREKYPRYPDYRGFNWLSYLKEKAKKREILIYRIKPGGKNNWLVKPDKVDIFLEYYPESTIDPSLSGI